MSVGNLGAGGSTLTWARVCCYRVSPKGSENTLGLFSPSRLKDSPKFHPCPASHPSPPAENGDVQASAAGKSGGWSLKEFTLTDAQDSKTACLEEWPVGPLTPGEMPVTRPLVPHLPASSLG